MDSMQWPTRGQTQHNCLMWHGSLKTAAKCVSVDDPVTMPPLDRASWLRGQVDTPCNHWLKGRMTPGFQGSKPAAPCHIEKHYKSRNTNRGPKDQTSYKKRIMVQAKSAQQDIKCILKPQINACKLRIRCINQSLQQRAPSLQGHSLQNSSMERHTGKRLTVFVNNSRKVWLSMAMWLLMEYSFY